MTTPTGERVVLKIIAAAGKPAGRDHGGLSQSLITSSTSALTNTQPFHNPMTATGDIVYADADGQLRRLPIGDEGDVLTVADIGGGVLGPRWNEAVPASASRTRSFLLMGT